MVGRTFGSIGVMMVEQDEHIGVLGGGGGPEGIVVACATAYKIRGETALVILDLNIASTGLEGADRRRPPTDKRRTDLD